MKLFDPLRLSAHIPLIILCKGLGYLSTLARALMTATTTAVSTIRKIYSAQLLLGSLSDRGGEEHTTRTKNTKTFLAR